MNKKLFLKKMGGAALGTSMVLSGCFLNTNSGVYAVPVSSMEASQTVLLYPNGGTFKRDERTIRKAQTIKLMANESETGKDGKVHHWWTVVPIEGLAAPSGYQLAGYKVGDTTIVSVGERLDLATVSKEARFMPMWMDKNGNVVEEPVVEETPVAEEPVVEETPVAEEPVVEETPVAEEPVVEETPVAEEPVVEETPVAEEPVVEETPVVEEPVVEGTPVAEEPVVEETPVAARPKAKKSVFYCEGKLKTTETPDVFEYVKDKTLYTFGKPEVFPWVDTWADEISILDENGRVVSRGLVEVQPVGVLYEDGNGIRYRLNENDKTAVVVAGQSETLQRVALPYRVYLGGTGYKIVKIESGAFSKCTKLMVLWLKQCRALMTIENDAIEKNPKWLTTVTLPESIQDVGENFHFGQRRQVYVDLAAPSDEANYVIVDKRLYKIDKKNQKATLICRSQTDVSNNITEMPSKITVSIGASRKLIKASGMNSMNLLEGETYFISLEQEYDVVDEKTFEQMFNDAN